MLQTNRQIKNKKSKIPCFAVLVIIAITVVLWLTVPVSMSETAGAQSLALQDSATTALVRDIENNLMAPCCWTQPISEHFSEITAIMREEVRAFVAEGKSRGEILDYYVGIYGERILAAPRARGINVLAYVAPFAALILGGWGLFQLREKRRGNVAAVPAIVAVTASATIAPLPPQPDDSRYNDIIAKELREFDD